MKKLIHLFPFASFPRLLAFALLFLWSGCIAGKVHAQPYSAVVDPYRFGLPDPCVTCTTNTSAFNVKLTGGANIANDATAFTGIADSKTVTVSFWIQTAATSGAMLFIAGGSGATPTFRVNVKADGKVQFVGWNSSGVIVLQLESTAAVINTGAWVHVLGVFDLTDTAKRKIYINGASVSISITTYTNDTMDLNPSLPYRALFNTDGTLGLNAFLAELWIDDSYNDNVCYFYCGGHPAVLGANGALPNGALPAAYYSLSGDDDSWFTDSSGNANTYSFRSGTKSHTTPP